MVFIMLLLKFIRNDNWLHYHSPQVFLVGMSKSQHEVLLRQKRSSSPQSEGTIFSLCAFILSNVIYINVSTRPVISHRHNGGGIPASCILIHTALGPAYIDEEKDSKEIAHGWVVIVTELFNIGVNDFDAKNNSQVIARCSL